MKILIKSTIETYNVLNRKLFYWHSACYYPFSFYKTFKEMGHDVKFYGQTPKKGVINGFEYEIINNFIGYDFMFWRGLESIVFNREFAYETVKNFKGLNCISLGTKVNFPILQHFNYMFPTEMDYFVEFYKEKFPNLKVIKIPLASPCYDFIYKEVINPYNDSKFKIIYVGIILSRYLEYLNKLAKKGEKIYLGGTYYPDKERIARKGVRPFTENEVKNLLHPNIKLLTPNGRFNYGAHFKYLKHANVGICFYPAPFSNALNCKLVDYLVCGLPTIVEKSSPNSFRVTDLNAGQLVNYSNFKSMYEAIQKEKEIKRDRKLIQQKSRKIFSINTNCKLILEGIK